MCICRCACLRVSLCLFVSACRCVRMCVCISVSMCVYLYFRLCLCLCHVHANFLGLFAPPPSCPLGRRCTCHFFSTLASCMFTYSFQGGTFHVKSTFKSLAIPHNLTPRSSVKGRFCLRLACAAKYVCCSWCMSCIWTVFIHSHWFLHLKRFIPSCWQLLCPNCIDRCKLNTSTSVYTYMTLNVCPVSMCTL